MKDPEFITGAVNEYYRDSTDATGIPLVTDEVYARRNPDRQSWTVYRLRTRPLHPNVFVNTDMTALFTALSGHTPPLFELPEVLASHINIKDAFELVRKNEIAPRQSLEGGVLRQTCRAEDADTHWARLPADIGNGPS